MKKILYFFLLLILPIYVDAAEIIDYKVNITVLENGDINILEIIDMEGEYNGYKRIIKYKDNYQDYYGDFLKSTEEDLYSGTKLIFNEVRAINFNGELSFEQLRKNGDVFTLVNNAKKGDYGTYTFNRKNSSYNYTIYNVSKMNKDFFVDYMIKDMVVTHSDVSELSMYLFTDITEDINNLEVYINVPFNVNLLNGWSHKKESKVEIVDNQTIKLNYFNLSSSDKVDFRIVFDPIDSKKQSDLLVLDNIYDIESKLIEEYDSYELEKEQAYQAVLKADITKKIEDYNIALDKVKKLDKDDSLKIKLQIELVNILSKIERTENNFKLIYTSIILLWVIGFLFMYYFIYRNYYKGNITNKNKYIMDIKGDYDPVKLSYLINKRINFNDYINYILYLIEDKKIKLIDNSILKRTNSQLDELDEQAIKYLFQNQVEIKLNELKNNILNEYDLYIASYNNWYNYAINVCEKSNLFQNTFKIKFIGIIYSLLGGGLGGILINKNSYIPSYFLIIICLFNLLFLVLFYKRTEKGKQDYHYFKSFKNYMQNFSKWETLPKLNVWGKYLIYSRVLRCNDILSKGMIVRFNSVKTKGYSSNYIKEKIEFQNQLSNLLKQCFKLSYNAKKNDS